MAAWLAQRGHKVDVVTGFPYYPEWKLAPEYRRTWFRKEYLGSVVIHRLPHYIPSANRVTSAGRMLLDLTLFISGVAAFFNIFFRDERPDVIIAVCPPLLSGGWPMIGQWLFRIPWVYHIQDFQVDAALQLGMLNKSLIGKLLYRVEKTFLCSATRVSSVSPAMCQIAKAKGVPADRLLSLPNWSDLFSIRPIKSSSEYRSSLGSRSDQIIVMYAGAMGRKQGLNLVLNAAELLVLDSRFHFVMIGSGSDAESLKLDAAGRQLSNIRFMSVQPVEHLNELLNAADIHLIVQKRGAGNLVMPSKLTNALASGKPAIVTADSGTDLYDVVVQSSGGLVIPPDDANALVAALQHLASDSARRASMGANGRRYAEVNFDKNRILSEFEKELFSIVDHTANDDSGGTKTSAGNPAEMRGAKQLWEPLPSATDIDRLTDNQATSSKLVKNASTNLGSGRDL